MSWEKALDMAKLMEDLTRYMRSAGYAMYLFSPIGLRTPSNRSFIINEIPRHFGYQPVRLDLPTISVDDICQPGPIELVEIKPENGNVSVLELAILAKLIVRFKPRRIFEFGTFDGRTTLNMAVNAPAATVYTLDLPRSDMNSTNLPVESADRTYIDKSASGRRFAESQHGHRIVQLYGDSATFDYTPYASNMDFIFVDGAHSFEYVSSDSANALQMLAKDGVIAWHDYASWPGATKALNALYRAGQHLRWIEGTSLAVRVE
jgi:predicted O-methyltransferase YrrM